MCIVTRKPSSSRPRRWTPVNAKKNSPLNIVIRCAWSGEQISVPSSNDPVMGSTTLGQIVDRVRPSIPALALWEEEGGETLACGQRCVSGSEWETTMLHQIMEGDDGSSRVMLDDGSEGVMLTLGVGPSTPAISMIDTWGDSSTAILADGFLYG